MVFNHTDYRLVSKRFIQELEVQGSEFIPSWDCTPYVGFEYSYVTYKRHERIAGESLSSSKNVRSCNRWNYKFIY